MKRKLHSILFISLISITSIFAQGFTASFASDTQGADQSFFSGQDNDKLTTELFQNYPNPFNGVTTVSFSLGKTMQVEVKIYNMLGKEVRTIADGTMSQGRYVYEFNASTLPKGYYFIQMKTDENVSTRKMKLEEL